MNSAQAIRETILLLTSLIPVFEDLGSFFRTKLSIRFYHLDKSTRFGYSEELFDCNWPFFKLRMRSDGKWKRQNRWRFLVIRLCHLCSEILTRADTHFQSTGEETHVNEIKLLVLVWQCFKNVSQGKLDVKSFLRLERRNKITSMTICGFRIFLCDLLLFEQWEVEEKVRTRRGKWTTKLVKWELGN